MIFPASDNDGAKNYEEPLKPAPGINFLANSKETLISLSIISKILDRPDSKIRC